MPFPPLSPTVLIPMGTERIVAVCDCGELPTYSYVSYTATIGYFCRECAFKALEKGSSVLSRGEEIRSVKIEKTWGMVDMVDDVLANHGLTRAIVSRLGRDLDETDTWPANKLGQGSLAACAQALRDLLTGC
jgi:hypothetical protein